MEPTSLTLLSCARSADRSGPTWQAVLEPLTDLQFVVSDGAKGIAAGVAAVSATRLQADAMATPIGHGLDVFHTAQEAQGALGGPWRQAEAAWAAAEQADRAVAAAKPVGHDARAAAARARAAWDRAEQRLAEVDRQHGAWERARAALGVFSPDGTLNDRAHAEAEIRIALAELTGVSWTKVGRAWRDRRSLAFLDRMHERLRRAVPDDRLRDACVRRWWLRHRRPATATAGGTIGDAVGPMLDGVIRDRSLDQTEQAAYDRVSAVLRTTVRASSAVEGINSVLRRQQNRHRRMTQGLLDLKRLYWNCRRLPTGHRRGKSPYEMLGARLPSTDFWTLLASPPVRAEEVSSE